MMNDGGWTRDIRRDPPFQEVFCHGSSLRSGASLASNYAPETMLTNRFPKLWTMKNRSRPPDGGGHVFENGARCSAFSFASSSGVGSVRGTTLRFEEIAIKSSGVRSLLSIEETFSFSIERWRVSMIRPLFSRNSFRFEEWRISTVEFVIYFSFFFLFILLFSRGVWNAKMRTSLSSSVHLDRRISPWNNSIAGAKQTLLFQWIRLIRSLTIWNDNGGKFFSPFSPLFKPPFLGTRNLPREIVNYSCWSLVYHYQVFFFTFFFKFIAFINY